MTPFEWAYAIMAGGSTAVLLLAMRRVGVKGEVFALGSKKWDPTALAEYRNTLRHQTVMSFWVILAAGSVAMGVLTCGLLKGLFFGPADSVTYVVGIVAGLGDSALFGYLLRIWRECGQKYKEAIAIEQ
jgi:hypothetical protein